MKIVERKTPKSWWVGKTCECNNCHTSVLIEAEDFPNIAFHGNGLWLAKFKCPKCNYEDIGIPYKECCYDH